MALLQQKLCVVALTAAINDVCAKMLLPGIWASLATTIQCRQAAPCIRSEHTGFPWILTQQTEFVQLSAQPEKIHHACKELQFHRFVDIK